MGEERPLVAAGLLDNWEVVVTNTVSAGETLWSMILEEEEDEEDVVVVKVKV